MTDKEQIIIDGVDVSECKCLHNVEVILEIAKPEDFEILCGATNGAIKCEKWKDCYFKQLARKTQECEQKDKELKELKRQYKLSCLGCEYKNTKADVERYRKECDFWKHQAELGSETTDRLAKQLEEKEQECEELKREVDEYKEVLECVEGYINNQGIDNKWNMRIQKFRSDILNIISKAKEEK